MFKYVFSLILVVIFCLVFLFDIALTNEAIGSLFVTGIDRPPIVVPPTVLVQRPPEAWGEGR